MSLEINGMKITFANPGAVTAEEVAKAISKEFPGVLATKTGVSFSSRLLRATMDPEVQLLQVFVAFARRGEIPGLDKLYELRKRGWIWGHPGSPLRRLTPLGSAVLDGAEVAIALAEQEDM